MKRGTQWDLSRPQSSTPVGLALGFREVFEAAAPVFNILGYSNFSAGQDRVQGSYSELLAISGHGVKYFAVVWLSVELDNIN